MDQLRIADEFPTAELMTSRWAALAAEIAEATGSLGSSVGKDRKGSLTILGSGIAHTDLTREVELQVRAADHVFYSINDYVTKTWLNGVRPDAYDLAILYSESLPRQATYTRMAEALLHFVRAGRKVVAVFYGHPGIFAAPGHRAIQIARKEGHDARMRPAVSALDCLIADVGFDPGLPGMLTYEATDMLLRRRPLDPTLHTVLWQVGVVGEHGYHRDGYENRGLGLLTDALESAYGPDYEIVHYIGAQYAGVNPRIERIAVAALRNAQVARRLTTLSTFYLPPARAAETDPQRAQALGVPQSREAPGIRSDLTRYGPREIDTLRRFADLWNADGYELKGWDAVLHFLEDLTQDMDLRARFETAPAAVLDGAHGSDLTERQKSLLCTRDQRAVVAAINEQPTSGKVRS
jgi:hypothetical protein